jgi:hypothetical protein
VRDRLAMADRAGFTDEDFCSLIKLFK